MDSRLLTTVPESSWSAVGLGGAGGAGHVVEAAGAGGRSSHAIAKWQSSNMAIFRRNPVFAALK